jgi:hypothetical protein
MALNRTYVVRGPAKVALGATALYTSEDDVKIITGFDLFDVPTCIGRTERRVKLRWARVEFTPAGHVTAAILAALYPHQTKKPGDSLLAATDANLVVTPLKTGQTIYTIKGFHVEKQPDLDLSGSKKPFGQCVCKAYGTSDVSPGTADSLITPTTTVADDNSFVSSTIVTQGYDATWATTPATTILTKEGWKASFDVATELDLDDFAGVSDIIVKSNLARVSCIPRSFVQTNPVDMEALLHTEVDAEKAIGATVNDAHGFDLTIANKAGGTTLSVLFNRARVLENAIGLGLGRGRYDSGLTWETMEGITSGALETPYTLTGA